MTSNPSGASGPPEAIAATAGLCAGCLHAKLVVSGRGSRFVLCERSRTDTRFPRYPNLPVISCTGFEIRAARAEPN